MTINDETGSPKHVAVGSDHIDAAAAFGTTPGDLFVTTYSALRSEVKLQDVRAFDLVAGPEATALIGHLGKRLLANDRRVRVAVPRNPAIATDPELADAIASAGADIANVEANPDFIVLTLGRGGTSADRIRTTLRLVMAAALPSVAESIPTAPAGRQDRTPVPPDARKPRPRPALLDELTRVRRWRDDTRRRVGLAVAALALVAVFIVLALLSASGRPLLVVGLWLLVLLVVAGFGWTVHTVLLLARQVDRQTARLEKVMRRDRAKSRNRHGAVLARVKKVSDELDRLKFIEEYTQAVAAHSAASDARMREVIARLDGDVSR